ncbi:MAG: GNAT family N-acetyltransferase [Clostridiaceae bacterium]|nr:GNAT family N-acetyltransferase [Clostridiaceae bacterium]
MNVSIRAYQEQDLDTMLAIWNEVVAEGIAFPQTERLDRRGGAAFFASQSLTAVAETDGVAVGLYILHPNNIGRCGHIANASYAVRSADRGLKIGEQLVRHSLAMARELGFRIMQFNAVVATNGPAMHLYDKLGFVRLGTIPGGFRMKDGRFEDIVLFYHLLGRDQPGSQNCLAETPGMPPDEGCGSDRWA